MFPFGGAEDNAAHPLAEDDHQLLTGLVHKYGVSSIMYALTGFGESSRSSIFSTNTLLSSANASINAPSLAWTSSEASQCRSDGASIHTQYTWPEAVAEMPPMHDAEAGKLCERSWLDSPAPVPSPMAPVDATSAPSPRLIAPTNKKYQCPMCYLDSSPVGFGRKSDFKKHLHNFHGADVVWICHTKGCHLSFSTERAYSTHAKEAHRMKALPNSAARTELCPQMVFACGFASCKERIFEASSADDTSAMRDKHFEHIAKHFEDDFDVSDWEFKIQVQNLLRQQQVKPVWKACIWPKEKRQNLTWRLRSSGELKRMLEARHLGNDVANLVRLAFLLGNAPYSASGAPPPAELDMHFQLPYRNQCPIDGQSHSPPSSAAKGEDDSNSTFSFSKYRSSTQTVFRLSSRNSKRTSRPPTPTPVTAEMTNDTVMAEDSAAGPHPGTPYSIPNEGTWHGNGQKFTPDNSMIPKQMNATMESPMIYPAHGEDVNYTAWQGMESIPNPHGMDPGMPHHMETGMDMNYHIHQPMANPGLYNYAMNASQASTIRPGTPVPSKRPGSWSRVMSMESLRQNKRMSAVSQYTPEMNGMMPTSMGM